MSLHSSQKGISSAASLRLTDNTVKEPLFHGLLVRRLIAKGAIIMQIMTGSAMEFYGAACLIGSEVESSLTEVPGSQRP
jgi:hypothetical protein